MKNNFLISVIVFFLGQFALAEDAPVVGVEKAAVRQSPSYMAAVVTTFAYGTNVKVLAQKPGWKKISANGTSGWVPSSSLGSSSSILRDIGRGDDASKEQYKDEVAAGGKGFSPEYEAMYKKDHPKLPYNLVDDLEQRKVDPVAVDRFAASGGLTRQGDGNATP